ncbi:hypothetical protein RclHR1_05880006 [Rhizophagus clarus]|uniref:Uncharacterized protein n=1 Tax=Rhizophagus clarus TaxID=94130 RepID=A0A2Z6RVA6_9GLOM|nr:hypothetical protein RclHR1_05880006 [Rhizophagus clarus]
MIIEVGKTEPATQSTWLSLPRRKFSSEKPKYDSQIYLQLYCAEKFQIAFILDALSNGTEKVLKNWEAYEKKRRKHVLNNV